MQNKWLEIIRERTIMGIKIKNLKYIFAAMNPPDYPGAFPLEPALADRFALIIPFPSSLEMGKENLRKIFCLGGESILNRNEIDFRVSNVLKIKIENARKKIRDKKLKKEAQSFVSFFWDKIMDFLSEETGFYISERRLRFILSNIEAYLALKNRKTLLPEDRNELFKILKWSIPDGVTEQVKESESFEFFIDEAIYDYFEKSKNYGKNLENILTLKERISKLVQKFNDSENIKEYVNAFFMITDFWKKVQRKKLFIDADTLELILDTVYPFTEGAIRKLAELTERDNVDFGDNLLLESVMIYLSKRKREAGFDIDSDIKEIKRIKDFLKTRRN